MNMRLPWLCLVVGVVVVACVPTKPPVQVMLPIPSLRVHDSAEVTTEGITVSITPISSSNVEKHAQIYKRFTFEVEVDEVDGLGNPTGAKVKQNKQVKGSVVPLPAFKVRIANNTGHVVRFTTSIFRLEDNVGQKYQTFASTQELLAWYEAALASAIPDAAMQQQIMQQSRGAIGSLQLLNRNVELLKGDEWSGFLIFNLDTGSEAGYNEFMRGIERLNLRLAEIPVEADDAGNVVRTTEFRFAIDKTTIEIAAMCPAEEKNPSWEVCTRKH